VGTHHPSAVILAGNLISPCPLNSIAKSQGTGRVEIEPV